MSFHSFVTRTVLPGVSLAPLFLNGKPQHRIWPSVRTTAARYDSVAEIQQAQFVPAVPMVVIPAAVVKLVAPRQFCIPRCLKKISDSLGCQLPSWPLAGSSPFLTYLVEEDRRPLLYLP